MKQIVIGDTHGRAVWKEIVATHPDADRIIFIGDYVDTHEDITPLEQINNLREIVTFKESCLSRYRWEKLGAEVGKIPEVILLIGNHDYHYWPGINEHYSGYQPQMRASFEYEYNTYKDLFQSAFVDENEYVYSHAGLTENWLFRNSIDGTDIHTIIDNVNQRFIHRPNDFAFFSNDRSHCGDHIAQGPFWVRPQSLYRDGISQLQIVGHTTQKRIEPLKSPRQGYYLIDTLGTSKEYLVINNGKIKIC